MKLIALFFPAMLAVAVRYHRNGGQKWSWFDYFKEYTISVIINVVLTQSVVQYLISDEIVDTSAFERFTFSTKYIVIACIFAFIVPYIYELMKKYITISLKVGENKDEK